jgi:hypothetical protein
MCVTRGCTCSFADGGVLSFVLIEKRFLVEVGRGSRCIPDLFICFRLTSDPLLKVL